MAKRVLYLETRVLLLVLSLVVSLGYLGVLSLLYRQERIQSLLWLLSAMLVLAAELTYGYRAVFLPYRRTKHILQLFASGYTFSSIIDDNVPLNKELEAVNTTLQSLLNTDQLMNASKRQAQFLALQNQINPHFLYNTLEGIRSEALLAGLDSVATMTEALSTFFRYTISNVENLVTLRQELDNTKNYFFIQQFRFGTRIKLHIVFDENENQDVLQYRIPKLTLQPIVENCIVHGLECKVGEGNLLIRIETSPSRLFITIRDDGVGMTSEILERMQKNLSTRSFDYVKRDEYKGGIALVNVNNRIKLLFGEQYGLSVTSQPGVGTDVMIRLPRSKEEENQT
ncbi:MAG: sensor histidine kinase [Sphaerochaeta sp.]|uniref:sensor histidine kinase n=1 Tax=Sphaerochaeta sp. TaxID=1972642 RepID=UPI002FCC0B8C